MNEEQLKNYCLTLMGATTDFQEEWGARRYHVGDKMFAMFGTDASGVKVVTMKCDPERASALREEYELIIPGYYMNKTHWNSIYLHADYPNSFVEGLLKDAHALVFHKLTKKRQKEIENM